MAIKLEEGGPVNLDLTITGQFKWGYLVLLDGKLVKKQKATLIENSSSVHLAADADELRGKVLRVRMDLVNMDNGPQGSDLVAAVTMGGEEIPPRVINAISFEVNAMRSRSGWENLE